MSVATKLDEVALRRETFREGPRVILGDGQEWTFPRPRIRFFPCRNQKTLQVESRFAATYGRDYELKIDEFLEIGIEHKDDSSGDMDLEALSARIMLQVEMAGILLLENYDLDDSALGDLLTFDFEDYENLAMWERITPILLGRAPKASPDGSD